MGSLFQDCRLQIVLLRLGRGELSLRLRFPQVDDLHLISEERVFFGRVVRLGLPLLEIGLQRRDDRSFQCEFRLQTHHVSLAGFGLGLQLGKLACDGDGHTSRRGEHPTRMASSRRRRCAVLLYALVTTHTHCITLDISKHHRNHHHHLEPSPQQSPILPPPQPPFEKYYSQHHTFRTPMTITPSTPSRRSATTTIYSHLHQHASVPQNFQTPFIFQYIKVSFMTPAPFKEIFLLLN